MKYKYLFGPVPSRRFGRSLGIDLVPMKTCTLDCVFCQLGKTGKHTRRRREYVDTESVISEMEDWCERGIPADFIALAGSGEPTLHTRFGDVLDAVRSCCGTPSALLTNGTLLNDPSVRSDACRADVVKIALSAWDQSSFERINRPDPDISFNALVDGEKKLREEFKGRIWLEVFLVPGLNSDEEDVRRIARIAEAIMPDKIHLNTAVRPPADGDIVPVPLERLHALAGIFVPKAEVIADFKSTAATGVADEDAVLAVLRRHPCDIDQIAALIQGGAAEASALVAGLTANGLVRQRRIGNSFCYVATRDEL